VTTSLVPAVKQRLQDRLQAVAALRDVEIAYTLHPDLLDREAIAFASSSFRHELGPLRAGRKSRDEEAEITLWINASQPGMDDSEADARAHTLFAALEDVLAEDPTLGFDEIPNGISIGTGTSGPHPGQEGWVGLIKTTITYTARLT
jgi:hypothetical protein